MYRLLFEQSGTFKNEFKKLGFEAQDYDIQNEFNETDNVIDLYNEIEKGYNNEPCIFDDFSKDDIVMAFFPCIRFENQIKLWFRGDAQQQKNWTLEQKLEKCISLQKELSHNYILISKLVIICQRKGLGLIIENPYSKEHYLTNYWCIKPKVVDMDRHETGDYFTKPTQYWFIGVEPKNNFIMEQVNYKKKLTISGLFGTKKTERSLISPDYANRFIREFIIDMPDGGLYKERTLFNIEEE